jgi:hypothetical protein
MGKPKRGILFLAIIKPIQIKQYGIIIVSKVMSTLGLANPDIKTQ